MLCTFCGTDNGPENKFCGMCGVPLERRKVERRIHQIGNLKCPSCQHVNEPGNQFCAKCGARVDGRMIQRRTVVPAEPHAFAIANAQLPSPEASTVEPPQPERALERMDVLETPVVTKASAPVFRSAPARNSTRISGPSFLGLSDDNGNRTSYLLEDEASSGGVLRKTILVIVLAAIGVLVFMQWRSGFPLWYAGQRWWARVAGGPASATQTKSAESIPAPAADVHEVAAGSDSRKASPATPVAAATNGDVSAPAPTRPADTVSTKTETPVATNESPSKPSAAREKEKATKNEQENPSPMLQRAQQYLQGTGGISQNCDQGLIYLRAAAKSEAAAAAQMGALYASGRCVPQDRVAAYRWLNSAHELQPGNPRIQTSMNQLWAEMTMQERGQIVR